MARYKHSSKDMSQLIEWINRNLNVKAVANVPNDWDDFIHPSKEDYTYTPE